MVMVKSLLCYCTLVWLSMRAVPVVVFQLGHFGRLACPLCTLPHMNVMLYTPGVLYQVILCRTKEAGYLPGWQAKTSGVLSRQQPAK